MALNKVPAQLIIGQRDALTAHAIALLKTAFCPNQGLNNCFCQHCRWISNRQHPSLVWINPASDYTLDDIAIIFEKTRFALDAGEQYFIVLDQAQNLGPATANRLLKTLEEPPAGYQFILLSTNESSMLPTISSRCSLTVLTATDSSFSQNPLLAFFLMPTQQDPFAFETELKRQQLKDTQSTEIFEQLVFLIGQRYKKALLDENSDATKKTGAQLVLLKTLLKKPPQSGSSDLFWKMAWLQWCSLNGTL